MADRRELGLAGCNHLWQTEGRSWDWHGVTSYGRDRMWAGTGMITSYGTERRKGSWDWHGVIIYGRDRRKGSWGWHSVTSYGRDRRLGPAWCNQLWLTGRQTGCCCFECKVTSEFCTDSAQLEMYITKSMCKHVCSSNSKHASSPNLLSNEQVTCGVIDVSLSVTQDANIR